MATKTTKPSTTNASKAKQAKPTKPSKQPVAPVAPAAPEVLHESSVQNPVHAVWAFAHKHHEALGRAECCRRLESMGVAHFTAKTQYQRAHAAGYPPKHPNAKAPAKPSKPTKQAK